MRRNCTCLILFISLIALSVPVLATELPDAVKQTLKQLAIPESAIGVFVQEIGANQPLITVNADVGMNPASVMKLLTTYAGLELLGPAYTWPTMLYANGTLMDGVLHGDLAIKGYGDPKLDLENFWLLIHRLRQTGLHEIRGDLILDNTHYAIPNDDPGDFDGQPYRTYNVIPEALLINYRASTIHFFPQPERNEVRVAIDPVPGSVQINNQLKLTHGTCGDWRNALTIDAVPDAENKNRFTVVLKGNFSSQCGKQSHMLSLQDSASYMRDLFRHLWMQQGGLFHGDVVVNRVTQGLIPLKVYQSPPLAEIVRGINKFSNNIAARQLYLALGTGRTVDANSPATLAKSAAAVKHWLAAKQLDFPELVVENGSGLSRKERISARHMGQLLLAAFDSPVMPEFTSSLPIAAIDGTLKNRFADSSVKGVAHMKTGALNDVRALAGYLLNKRGNRVVMVFFVNHEQADKSRDAMDALVQWVYER